MMMMTTQQLKHDARTDHAHKRRGRHLQRAPLPQLHGRPIQRSSHGLHLAQQASRDRFPCYLLLKQGCIELLEERSIALQGCWGNLPGAEVVPGGPLSDAGPGFEKVDNGVRGRHLPEGAREECKGFLAVLGCQGLGGPLHEQCEKKKGSFYRCGPHLVKPAQHGGARWLEKCIKLLAVGPVVRGGGLSTTRVVLDVLDSLGHIVRIQAKTVDQLEQRGRGFEPRYVAARTWSMM